MNCSCPLCNRSLTQEHEEKEKSDPSSCQTYRQEKIITVSVRLQKSYREGSFLSIVRVRFPRSGR